MKVNNNLIETEEMQQIGYKLLNLLFGMCIRIKPDVKSNIEPMHFHFCLWGAPMGMIQLIMLEAFITTGNRWA
jgi:hypothetical protein